MNNKKAQALIDRARAAAASPGALSIYSSLVSIVVGVLLGFILLVVFNTGAAGNGVVNLLTTAFREGDQLAKLLYQAAPLIFVGVAVGFAFKTGLFNIGATGQYTIGAFMALFGAITLQLPWYLCLVLAMIGGAIWGLFPGLFKALFNVNEVITSIMFNWIGLFLVNLLVNNVPMMLASAWPGSANSDRTAPLGVANPGAILPRVKDILGEGAMNSMNKGSFYDFANSNYINIGILIAIVFAIIAHFILNRTTFGYELKACGSNRDASIYAGIDAKRNIILSMVISGAFAGIGGGIAFLSGTVQFTIGKTLLAMGFNGIPVALLAASHPIGIIFAALFIAYIQVGGDALQPEYAKEIIDIIIAAIIYLSAFALLMKSVIEKVVRSKKAQTEQDAANRAETDSDADSAEEILPNETDISTEEEADAQ